MKQEQQLLRQRRKKRVRAKVRGNKQKPRLSVFCSNKKIYAQLIDDEKGTTLISANETELNKPKKTKIKLSKLEKASQLGKLLAQKAKEKSIKKVAFDRGSYKYHGRVKALAEAARKQGLEF